MSPADSWSATGTASTTATSNYSLADPTLDYSVVGSSGSWKYSATAKTARQQTVNWHYKGYHAWYQVSVAIEKFVIRNGTEIVTETLRSAGPVNCCTSPSGGFDYTGTTTFDLQPGDVYGFRMSGSHQDSDQRLIGTLSLDLPGYQRPVQTRCAAPAVGFGFSVRAGDVIDAVSLECAVPGSHSASPMVGGTGGIPKGTALCPKGYALTGLQGTVNNTWFNALNVVGLTGVCTHYPDSGLGATGAGVLAYKGTSPKGAVKFIVAPKKGKALGAGKSGWDYTLGGFAFATGCSRASAKVPGKVAVFARGSAGQATRFSLTAGRFSITGRLSGALRKPKVSGTLKILTGACKGRTLRFTATASR